jgi:hypothetical protein
VEKLEEVTLSAVTADAGHYIHDWTVGSAALPTRSSDERHTTL